MDIKRIAALTGVLYYLKEEELNRDKEKEGKPAGIGTDPWAHCGREAIMSGRELLQRRVFTVNTGRSAVNVSASGSISRTSRIKALTGNIIRNIIRNRNHIK